METLDGVLEIRPVQRHNSKYFGLTIVLTSGYSGLLRMSVTFFSCLMTVATCSDNSKAVKHHVTLAQLGKVHMRVKLELFLPLFYYTFFVSLFCFLLIHTLLHSKKIPLNDMIVSSDIR